MKTISFSEVLSLGVKTVKVVTDGYGTEGFNSYWKPFERTKAITFKVNRFFGTLDHSWLYVKEEEETYTLSADGSVTLYYPDTIQSI